MLYYIVDIVSVVQRYYLLCVGSGENIVSTPNSFDFPKLCIDPDNVNGSWQDFIKMFDIEMQIQSLTCGTKVVKNSEGQDTTVPVFDNNLKCLALFRSIGIDGLQVFEAKGHDVRNNTLSYEEAIAVLQDHYSREENINVKTKNFVSVCQDATEDLRDYLLRVESLSRKLSYFTHATKGTHKILQTARERMAVIVAVNGLCNTNLRIELMTQVDLTWSGLCNILKSRSTAVESGAKLDMPVNMGCNSDMSKFTAGCSRDDNIDTVQVDRQFDTDSRGGSTKHTPSHNTHSVVRHHNVATSSSEPKLEKYVSSPKVLCYNCKQMSYHIARYCPKIRCYKCLGFSHVAAECKSTSQTVRNEGITGLKSDFENEFGCNSVKIGDTRRNRYEKNSQRFEDKFAFHRNSYAFPANGLALSKLGTAKECDFRPQWAIQ